MAGTRVAATEGAASCYFAGGFADMLLSPFAFYWSFGEFHVKLAQWRVAPPGRRNVTSLITVGRNYSAFDTQLGLTWFHKATGTELTVLPGLMLNTINPATDDKIWKPGDIDKAR